MRHKITPKLKIFVALASIALLFSKSVFILIFPAVSLFFLTYKKNISFKKIFFFTLASALFFLPCLILPTKLMLTISSLAILRSLIIYLAITIIAENIDSKKFIAGVANLAGKRFALLLSLTLNIVPTLQQILTINYGLYYLRCEKKGLRFKKMKAYGFSVFKQFLTTANSCAENMILDYKISKPLVVVISGGKHCGKTSFAEHLIEDFKSKNWPVSGILAPSTIENSVRASIYVKNIKTNETKLLASRTKSISDCKCVYGGFTFSQSALNFAETSLLDYTQGNIVFIDEVGPLELSGLGYANAFNALLSANISALFVVIRKPLVKKFLEEFNVDNYQIIDINANSLTNTNCANEPPLIVWNNNYA